MTNPYAGLADHQFWRRAVSRIEPFRMDPVTSPRFRIGETDRVATAGSCFAQHISRSLQKIGSNYYVAETPPDDASEAAIAGRNYGVFSARYGNIYTARQLLQLFQESQGRRSPAETAWLRQDGALVDPYRPQIEPAGFTSEDALRASREAHLQAVRTMFASADIFIFTLGLTEGWCSRLDGSVFPLAPGVAGGSFAPDRHEFVNFTAAETEADLAEFIEGLSDINPRCRIILTVSPVPLIATYEDRHVLVSTTYSKSVLRVAAEGIFRRYPHVAYFPSYEIITGNYNRAAYYEDDLRDVTRGGVAHAMRIFLKHYGPGAPLQRATIKVREAALGRAPAQRQAEEAYDVVCDEEAIDQVRA